MATHVLISMPAAEDEETARAKSRIKPGLKMHLRQSNVFMEQDGCVYVATAAGLCGAKGAMMALGLQAAIMLAAGCVWLVWQMAR